MLTQPPMPLPVRGVRRAFHTQLFGDVEHDDWSLLPAHCESA
jgi:hypothetical protein